MARANISVNSFGHICPWIDSISSPGLSLGYPSGSMSIYGDSVLELLQKEHQTLLLKKCFPQFGTISDGSPSFAKAEAIRICKVTKKFDIIELLVCFKLMKEALDGYTLAHHLLETIIKDCKENPNNWVTAMNDRASVNRKSIDCIEEKTMYKPSQKPCIAHTLVDCGKHFNDPKGEFFRMLWNRIIAFRGKVTDKFQKEFRISPLKAGEVCWCSIPTY
eukprot:9916039-Ditylum_brightwellii.AAC.1